MPLPTTFPEQTALDFNNPLFRTELENLQANILKGHGRRYTSCVFLKFRTGEKAGVKDWIRQLNITSAYQQLSDTANYKAAKRAALQPLPDGEPVICFFLASSGYQLLEIEAEAVPNGTAFNAGMEDRVNILKDPPKEDWQQEYRIKADAMLLVADKNPRRLHDTVQKILESITDGIITVTIIQKGEVLKKDGLGIEHFGYADALSQPQYLNDYETGKVWDDTMPLSTVLVKDAGYKNEKGEVDPTCYGSYFVFRKLEQHVKAFSEQEESLGNTLFATKEEDARKELAGAYLVGRFENSTPVVKHQTEMEMKKNGKIDNDFNYENSSDFSKCPYHAHIRLTNPRNAMLTDMEKAIPGYKKPSRITRRGIPYDEAGRNSNMEWKPEGNVGLLFMAYQNSIEESFETMQASANIADGIIGQQTDTANQLWPMQWGDSRCHLKGFGFEKFVTMKGGEYFFAPSLPFLKNL
ncbi:MAG: hypothetical protein ABIQ88_09485 [Chitinophagaceae bacterium]